MGTVWNDSILFDFWHREDAEEALGEAERLGLPVSDLVPQHVNGGYSLAVLPDGSKLGWATRRVSDDAREALKEAVRDRRIRCQWVHVRWGECGPLIVDSNYLDDSGDLL